MSNFIRVILVLLATFVFGSQNASAAVDYVKGTIDCPATTDMQFVPSWGAVEAGEDQYTRYIYQWMYWDNADRLTWLMSNADSTFEPDALFYNYDGTAYGNMPWPLGYWASDLPSPYVDDQIGDDPGEKAVTIGSGYAVFISPARVYYTVTRMTSGGGNSSWLKLSSQRGRQWPTGCTAGLCSFGCDTTNNIKTMSFNSSIQPTGRIFTAPSCMRYWYNWQYYPSPFFYDC